jgi:two-component system sensor histidine kinase BaeS
MIRRAQYWPWLTLQIIGANVAIIIVLALAWYLAFIQQSSAYSERLMATFNIESGSLHAMYVDDVERQLWISVTLGLAFAVVASIGLALIIVRPLRTLAMATKRLRHGDYLVRTSIKTGEVGRLAGHFNALASALEQEERRRAQFMSDLGHELRTPIMSLRGYTEGLEDGIFKADADFHKLIAGELSHLTALTHTIDTMSLDCKASSRADEDDLHLYAIASLLDSAKLRWSGRFQLRDMELTMRLPEDLNSDRVTISARSLRQIIDNLLSNMHKYATSDGPCEIEVFRDANSISLVFSNQAPDLTSDSLPYLFDRFYRISQSRTRNEGDHSSGLGLSVVRQLCVLSNGNATAILDGEKLSISIVLPVRTNNACDGIPQPNPTGLTDKGKTYA